MLLCWCQKEKEKNESKRREPMKQALIGFWSVVTFLKKKKRFTGGATSQKRRKSFTIKSTGRTHKKKKKRNGEQKKSNARRTGWQRALRYVSLWHKFGRSFETLFFFLCVWVCPFFLLLLLLKSTTDLRWAKAEGGKKMCSRFFVAFYWVLLAFLCGYLPQDSLHKQREQNEKREKKKWTLVAFSKKKKKKRG